MITLTLTGTYLILAVAYLILGVTYLTITTIDVIAKEANRKRCEEAAESSYIKWELERALERSPKYEVHLQWVEAEVINELDN
tara:strand:+ start:1966 stop:2214 length:249 start_codon:yes stop_codon:yes gene_type:complete